MYAWTCKGVDLGLFSWNQCGHISFSTINIVQKDYYMALGEHFISRPIFECFIFHRAWKKIVLYLIRIENLLQLVTKRNWMLETIRNLLGSLGMTYLLSYEIFCSCSTSSTSIWQKYQFFVIKLCDCGI